MISERQPREASPRQTPSPPLRELSPPPSRQPYPPPSRQALARPPRDLRLDVVRGWMQLSIFISHVAGTACIWLIHASWGLSDSSEQFVFLSASPSGRSSP